MSAEGPTVIHRWPPKRKLLLCISVVVAGVSVPVALWPLQGLIACFVFVGLSVARVPLAVIGRRLCLFLPVVLLLSVSVPASTGFVSTEGWRMMGAILGRSTLAFLGLLWLIRTTRFEEILVALSQLRVPTVFVVLLAFMYRYSYVLFDELQTMRSARSARQFGQARAKWRSAAHLVGMLLIRSMDRAERVHQSMVARNWDGTVRTLDWSNVPIDRNEAATG